MIKIGDMRGLINVLALICIMIISVTKLYTQEKFPEDKQKRIQLVKKNVVTIERIETREMEDIFKGKKDYKTTSIGTGFLVHKSGSIYVITCYHVIKDLVTDKKEANKYRTERDKNRVTFLIGINTANGKVYGIIDSVKSSEESDIGVMFFNGKCFNFNKIDSIKINMNQIAIDIKGKEKEDKSPILKHYISEDTIIKPGMSVFSFGYPLNMGSTIHINNPILRAGTIAQDVNEDGTFLVDMISQHGNSGSPLYMLENSILIGMVKQIKNDYIDAYTKEGVLLATYPYNAGFTYCVSIKTILEFLNICLNFAPIENGIYSYRYKNGMVKSRTEYKDGKTWNAVSAFDLRGNALDKGTLREGNGTLKIYDENGKAEEIEYYKNGKLIKKEELE
jgi:hypothetical protein